MLIKPAESRVWPWQAAPGRWWGQEGLRGALTPSVGVVTPVGPSHEWLSGRARGCRMPRCCLWCFTAPPGHTGGEKPSRAAQTAGALPAPQCIPKTRGAGEQQHCSASPELCQEGHSSPLTSCAACAGHRAPCSLPTEVPTCPCLQETLQQHAEQANTAQNPASLQCLLPSPWVLQPSSSLVSWEK